MGSHPDERTAPISAPNNAYNVRTDSTISGSFGSTWKFLFLTALSMRYHEAFSRFP
jgi:hypothetical protein